MKLTLIRHGETEGNRKRLYYGSADLPLLPESFARLAALAARGAYPKAESYYTSGMLRTEQTLEAIYGQIPHGAIPCLREIDFGRFEMKTYEELKDDPYYLEWISGNNEANVCPGGESGVMVTRRALWAIERLAAFGRDAVCITHGGVIGGALAALFPGCGGRYAFTPRPGEGFTVTFIGAEPTSFEKLTFE